MPENVYEGMYILDTNRYARDAGGVAVQISEMIEKLGGTILASRLWEERRLAYPVDGHRKGTYWLTYFKLESSQVAPLTRQCQLNDNMLRTLFLKVDPRIAETLVSHALSTAQPQRRAPTPEPVAVPVIAGVSADDIPSIDDL